MWGGLFSQAGGNPANNIAKWDGTSWSALGSGVNSQVNAIALSGTDIYVCGNFTTAGGNAANHIAKWDTGTSTWSALGGGLSGPAPANAYALAVTGTGLYVGGDFTTAGGAPASRMAKWNGTAWQALGAGVGGGVRGIVASGTDVYVGGDFTEAGGAPASRMAKWNGTSWSALGSGLNAFVRPLAVSGTDVYAGGFLPRRKTILQITSPSGTGRAGRPWEAA